MTESEWHAARRLRLGASEVAAVIGCDPHRTPLDVWADKVLPPRPRRETPEQQAGHVMEPAALRLYEIRMRRNVERGRHILGPEPWMACTPDGLDPAPVQVKMVGRWYESHWGDDGAADGVPVYYIPQIQWEIMHVGSDHGHFIAGFSMTDFRIYRVERDDVLIKIVVDYCRDWWQEYVVPMDPAKWPPGGDADAIARAIKNLYPRTVRAVREATPEEIMLVANYSDARAAAKAAVESQKAAGNALALAIADGEGWRGDWGVATNKANKAGNRQLYVRMKGEADE